MMKYKVYNESVMGNIKELVAEFQNVEMVKRFIENEGTYGNSYIVKDDKGEIIEFD